MDRFTDPQYRTEDGNALRIWRDAAQNNFLSEREGRPVYDEVIYVEVIAPGSANSTPVFEAIRYLAKESGRKDPKYGSQYERFKKYVEDFTADEKNDAALSGTPLAQWPEMSRTLVAELKAQKIFTVDALAQLPDTRLGAVGPDGRTWREKAKAFLESAKGNSYATALAADLEKSKNVEADLRGQIAALAATVESLQQQAAGKPGKSAKGNSTVTVVEPDAATVVDPNAVTAGSVATVEPDASAQVIDGLDGKFGNNAPII